MNKNLINRTLMGLLTTVALTLAGAFFLPSATKVSGQSASTGWVVWVKTSPCSGRTDWISVAKENPGFGGTGHYEPATLIQSSLKCRTRVAGCTFAEATAEANVVRASPRFFNYCCRDYSVWRNPANGAMRVVQGKFGKGGYDFPELVKGDLCCEEAATMAGKPNLCGTAQQQTSASYLGCYKDPNNPYDLDGHLVRSQTNTPQRCIETCRAKGFAYAGVQYGQSCLCGNSYGKFGKANNCNMTCTGDSRQNCGGYNSNAVYATGINKQPRR
jgi:hypothetical protein